MKITDICESTTAGSVATVAAPMNGKSLKRVGQGVYGKEKGGNLLTGKKTSKKYANQGVVAESVNEDVGGNYLYYSRENADEAKQILSSGYILGNTASKQAAADVQTNLPVVSFGRNLNYQMDGSNVGRNYQVVFVFDRKALEARYKTLGVSQSRDYRGQAYADKYPGHERMRKNIAGSNGIYFGQHYKSYKDPKAGGEFEEVVPTKTGKIPLQGILVGFYLVPGKAAAKDEELLNNPLRLEMPRPNTFVKANKQAQQAQQPAETPAQRQAQRQSGQQKSVQMATARKAAAKTYGAGLAEAAGEFKGEHVTVLYVDDKPAVKYTDITKAKKEMEILKKNLPNKKFELKTEIREAGMPQSVLKNKQKLAGMTDAELADHLKGKSDDELKQMAWRHGYGKMSSHYVNRVNKGKGMSAEIKEAGMPQSVLKNKQKLAGMTDAELADHLKGKSDDELKRLAWRHGYGNMSSHYVNRIKKVTESTDTTKYKVQIICDDGGETSYTVSAKTKEEALRKATKFANDDEYEDFYAKIITEPNKKPVRESVGYPGIKDDEELREFQKYPDAFSLYNKLRKDGVTFTKVHPRGKNRVDFDIVMSDRRNSLIMSASSGAPWAAMYEERLEEDDLILIPGQGHKKGGFISRAEDRRDHEVEMARSDLYQAHKNSSKIHKLIKNVSEDEGLEGWVQAKITKAADYLNSVRQYLEGKQLQEMTGGVIAGGGVGESLDGGPLDTNSMMYDSHFAAHYEKQPPVVQSSLDTYLKAGLSYPDAVDKVTNGPSAAKYRITPLRAGPLLGRGMSSDARARDVDQSDIEYIEQRQFKDQWKQENPGKKWPGYDKAGFKSRYDSKWD